MLSSVVISPSFILPIRTINFTDPLDKARHDRVVALVSQMIDPNKKLQDVRLPSAGTSKHRHPNLNKPRHIRHEKIHPGT